MANLVSTLDSTGNLLLGNYGSFDETLVGSGGNSVLLNGTNQFLSVANNAQLVMSTGDFTVEGWVRFTSTPAGAVFSKRLNGGTSYSWVVFDISGGTFRLLVSNAAGTTWTVNSQGTFPALSTGIWYHFAIVRENNFLKGYQDGILRSNSTITAATVIRDDGARFVIGDTGQNAPVGPLNAYITNFRVVKGTAVYTSNNFVVPTSPLTAITNTSLLTAQSPTIIDNSPNNFTVTNNNSATITDISPFPSPMKSRQFNNGTHQIINTGTYDEVTLPDLEYSTRFNYAANAYISAGTNTGLALGAGNFTIESWIYPTFWNPATSLFWDYRTNGATPANTPAFAFTATGAPNFYISVPTVAISGSSVPTLNTWNHIAVVRSNANISMYLNGTNIGNVSSSANLVIQTFGINSPIPSANYVQPGFYSNFRIVKGTALYTSNFTPPREILTAVANTALLTCQNSTIVNNANNAIILNVGNTSLVTTTNFPVGYCNSFNGSGQYLTAPSNTVFDFGTGDFTIECWVYPTSLTPGGGGASDSSTILSTYPSSGSITAYALSMATNGLLTFTSYLSSTQQLITASTNALSVNNWYHIAITKSSSTFKIFVNGVLTAFTGSITQPINSGSNAVKIGALAYTTYYNYFTGFISNVRIVKGTALYANTGFIPTPPLTAVANTVLLTCQSPTIIDNSPNAFTITNTGNVSVLYAPVAPSPQIRQYNDGSYHIKGQFDEVTLLNNSYSSIFNGTNQYLTTPSNATLTLDTGNFTMETWIYQTATSAGAYKVILADGVYGSAGGWTLYSYNNALNLWKGGTSAVELIAPSGSISLNTWTHVAWTRNGSDNLLFINGIQVGSNTDSTNFTSTQVYIGASRVATLFFPGYMSNLRIVKGSAVYTSNFTPSLKPLTAIANTVLLTCQNSTFIDNSINNFTIANTGSVTTTISTLPFF
jgi:hypothetical protein